MSSTNNLEEYHAIQESLTKNYQQASNSVTEEPAKISIAASTKRAHNKARKT